VAKDRLRTRLGVAPSAALEAIARALADTLGLPPDMAL